MKHSFVTGNKISLKFQMGNDMNKNILGLINNLISAIL